MAAKKRKIDADNPAPDLIDYAASLLSRGEVIVCPTDTGYALTANALDPKAVLRIFRMKGRVYANPIHVAVHSIKAAERYAYLNQAAEILARRFLPGALTMVLPKKDVIPSMLVSGKETVGIRIPDNKIILELAAITDMPLTATSANLSGQPTPYSAGEAMAQLSASTRNIALVLDQGEISQKGLSTIVDLTVEPAQLIRQGVLSWLDIRQILRSETNE
ncbi:L-threonylcarbamoyladenylate synthase [Chloroflexota bacterium]